jgi:hypothetical protein
MVAILNDVGKEVPDQRLESMSIPWQFVGNSDPSYEEEESK